MALRRLSQFIWFISVLALFRESWWGVLLATVGTLVRTIAVCSDDDCLHAGGSNHSSPGECPFERTESRST